MTAGAGMTAYKNKVEAKLVGAGFDPTLLLTLLAALLPLITQFCSAKAMRRRLGNRARLAVAFMRQDDAIAFADAFKLADAHFDAADIASDEELLAFRDDCCSEK